MSQFKLCDAAKSCALAAALALGAVACTSEPQRWENPAVSSDRWQADTAVCRSDASTKAREEERQANSYGTPSTAGMHANMPNDAFQTQMGQVSQLRRQRDLFESCMQGQGYRPAGAAGK